MGGCHRACYADGSQQFPLASREPDLWSRLALVDGLCRHRDAAVCREIGLCRRIDRETSSGCLCDGRCLVGLRDTNRRLFGLWSDLSGGESRDRARDLGIVAVGTCQTRPLLVLYGVFSHRQGSWTASDDGSLCLHHHGGPSCHRLCGVSRIGFLQAMVSASPWSEPCCRSRATFSTGSSLVCFFLGHCLF